MGTKERETRPGVTVEFTKTGEKITLPETRSQDIKEDGGPYLIDKDTNADLILDAKGKKLPSGPWKISE